MVVPDGGLATNGRATLLVCLQVANGLFRPLEAKSSFGLSVGSPAAALHWATFQGKQRPRRRKSSRFSRALLNRAPN